MKLNKYHSNQESILTIVRYVNGGRIPVALLQMSGTEGAQMESDLKEPGFRAALEELGYRFTHTKEKGVLRLRCYHKRDLPVETPLAQAA